MNPPIFVNVATSPHTPEDQKRISIRYDDFVNRLLKPDSIKMTALHIGLGIAGEALEFAEAHDTSNNNLVEELGDLEFYLQALQTFYGITYADSTTQPVPNLGIATQILISSGILSDLIKKEFIYGKAREIKKVILAVQNLRQALDAMYAVIFTNRTHVLQCNAIKLEIRYAGLMYSSDAAIARVDKPAGS